MPEIKPFRGVRYNLDVGEAGSLVSPPYDVIDRKMQQKLYDAHPNNVVRIIQGKEEVGDSDAQNQYTRAARNYRGWLETGVLRRDEEESIYAYVQKFQAETPAGPVSKSRVGIVALVRVEPFGEGSILPHEHTMPGPKADRLALMNHTGAAFGQIFSLFSDPENIVQGLLAPHLEQAPTFTFEDGDDVTHQFWQVKDRETLKGVIEALSDKPLFIADGHHRYETAVTYRDDRAKKEGEDPSGKPYGYRMQTMVNMDDTEGMAINPIHRVVMDLGGNGVEQLLAGLEEFFDIRSVPFVSSGEVLGELQNRSESGDTVYGLCTGDMAEVRYLTLKQSVNLPDLDTDGHSDAWRRLDSGLLQMVLGKILDLDTETLIRGEKVRFVKVESDVASLLAESPDRVGFFLNSVDMDQLRAVVLADERMPPKSTFFYPKVFSGLVIQDLNSF